MRAAVLRKAGAGLRIEEVPEPEIGSGAVLVKVAAAGICHTDLGIVDGKVPIGRLPMIPGHEVAGVIVRAGEGVSGELVGKRVCVSYGVVCGTCFHCQAGNDTLCERWQTMGRTVDGGFAEFMAAPAENAIALPDHVGYEAGAIIPCSVATAFRTVRRAGVGPTRTVAVFGVGGVGLNAVQFAVLAGAEVIAVDLSDRKLERALALGARHGVNAGSEDAVAAVRRLTGGRGADASLEFVGSPASYQACLDSARRGGRVVIAGFHPEPLQVSALRLMLDEVTITGAHVANRSEIVEIVHLLAERRIDLAGMVTHTVAFEDIQHGFDRLRSGEGDPVRVVVTF